MSTTVRRRDKQTVAQIEHIIQVQPFLQQNVQAQQQLREQVTQSLDALRAEGKPRASLCDEATCRMCYWNTVRYTCTLCSNPFNSAKTVYPLYLPIVAGEEGAEGADGATRGRARRSRKASNKSGADSDDEGDDSVLHIELCLLCSERCARFVMEGGLAALTTEQRRSDWGAALQGRGRAQAQAQGQGHAQAQGRQHASAGRIPGLHAPPSTLELFWHVFRLILCVYTLGWKFAIDDLNEQSALLFTSWQLVIELVAVFFLCLRDVLWLIEASFHSLLQVRKITSLLLCAGFVASVGTALGFWTLFALDRELVHPRALDALPDRHAFGVLNQLQHTTPALFSLAHLLLVRSDEMSFPAELGAALAGPALYLAFVAAVFAAVGRVPYPFLQASGASLALFAGAALAAAALLHLAHVALRRRLWGRPAHEMRTAPPAPTAATVDAAGKTKAA